MQQLQSLAISSRYEHSVLNHIFSLTRLHLHPQSSKIQGLCGTPEVAYTNVPPTNTLTPFVSCNRNNLSHPEVGLAFFLHPLKFYLLKYRWWQLLVLLLTALVISPFSTGSLSYFSSSGQAQVPIATRCSFFSCFSTTSSPALIVHLLL